jgi:glycosyltransferase involved in cell wall biosynthesis
LIRAYKELLSQAGSGSSKIPKLVIAGPGLESGYGQQMLALVSALQLCDQVSFPGMLSGDEKWGAFYGCDAFILPSHQENFGIAVVEALSCGRPVLISTQVNICNEIRASGGGLVEDDTPNGIYNLLNSWMNMSPEEKELMGSNALKIFQSRFYVKSAVKQMLTALVETSSENESLTRAVTQTATG